MSRHDLLAPTTKTSKEMQEEREQMCYERGHIPRWTDGNPNIPSQKYEGWICDRCDRRV